MVGKIKKFLSLFGDPGIFTYPDAPQGVKPTGFDYGTYADVATCHAANSKMTYALAFEPAGNLNKVNVPGERIMRAEKDLEDYIPAVWLDIDFSEALAEEGINDHESLMEWVLDMSSKHELPLHFITKTVGGVHLYFMVAPDDRANFAKGFKKSFADIQRGFAECYQFFDKNALGLNRIMRLPFTTHWSSGVPRLTELYRVEPESGESIQLKAVKCETEDDVRYDEGKALTLAWIRQYAKYAKETYEMAVLSDAKLQLEVAADKDIIDKIPGRDVVLKLEKYPRQYKGDSYVFKLDRKSLSFMKTDGKTGEITHVETDGYKYNPEGNYFNCFSKEWHPIEERPRGPIYPFLFHYFNGEVGKIRDFLKAEFSIDLHQRWNNALMPALTTGNGTIRFTSSGVVYSKQVKTKEGDIVVMDVILFRIPFKVTGVIRTKWWHKGELPTAQNYYIIERYDRTDDRESVIEFHEDRKRFNRTYGKTGFIFHGTESDLLDFYLAVNSAVAAGQVDHYDHRYLNGWTKDNYLCGKALYDFKEKDFVKLESVGKTHFGNEPIPFTLVGKSSLTCKEYLDQLSRCWSPRISASAFLSFCVAALGNGYWDFMKNAKAEYLVPGLFLTGITKVGKSTLLSTLKEGFGTTADARKVSAKSTTPQPLKHQGTDQIFLHVEEFTGDVRSDRESIIRDIINRSRSMMGTLGGENVEYVYRSTVVIDGERLPAQASVTNRCIVVPMFEKERIGTATLLSKMRQFEYFRDLMDRAYEFRRESNPVETWLACENACIDAGYTDRKAHIRAYLLYVWRMCEMGTDKRFFELMSENVNSTKSIDSSDDLLTTFCNWLVLDARVSPNVTRNGLYVDSTECTLETITFPIPPSVKETRSVDIAGIISSFPDVASYDDNQLSIKYVREKRPDMVAKFKSILTYSRSTLEF
jgi:hypothetical protein